MHFLINMATARIVLHPTNNQKDKKIFWSTECTSLQSLNASSKVESMTSHFVTGLGYRYITISLLYPAMVRCLGSSQQGGAHVHCDTHKTTSHTQNVEVCDGFQNVENTYRRVERTWQSTPCCMPLFLMPILLQPSPLRRHVVVGQSLRKRSRRQAPRMQRFRTWGPCVPSSARRRSTPWRPSGCAAGTWARPLWRSPAGPPPGGQRHTLSTRTTARLHAAWLRAEHGRLLSRLFNMIVLTHIRRQMSYLHTKILFLLLKMAHGCSFYPEQTRGHTGNT